MKRMRNYKPFIRMPLVAAIAAMTSVNAVAATENPYLMPDESFVTLSGRVSSAGNDEFELDYGDGSITVEMDDWDRDSDAAVLKEGDQVTVYGRVDDDFFERTTVEAGAVYVEELKSYFYASSADEETATFIPRVWVTPSPMIAAEMTIRGEVQSVDALDESFVVKVGDEEVVIKSDELGYNPVDDYGYQQIEEGDWVSVSGDLDYRLLQGQVLSARSVTTLVDESFSDASS